MKRIGFFVLSVMLALMISKPVFAGPYSTTQLETLNFNLRIIMTGVDFYYGDTGEMPNSVGDLLQAGWIPRNLRNPITDRPYDYYAPDVSSGEIVLLRSSDSQCTVVCLSPIDTIAEFQIDSADIDQRMPFGADLRMDAYQIWLQYSLFWYWNLYHEIPYTMEDMEHAGVWPFDGSEVNPYTYGPLTFNGENPGDIYFAANETEIKFTIYYSNNVIGFAGLRKDDIGHIDHF